MPSVPTSPYIDPSVGPKRGRAAGRSSVLPVASRCVTMGATVPNPSLRSTLRDLCRKWLPRSIGLAGLCLFARVSAPLPVHAQSPSAEPEKAEEKRQSATTTQTSGSEASSRDQSTDVEASSASPTRPPARAQRLARREAIGPAPTPDADRDAERSSADPGRDRPSPERTATRRPGRGTAGGRKISLEDEFVIEGKLEKPSAYYILRRSTVDYDWARLDARFSPLVLESVQDPLF